jgi:hypothetical protein
MTQINPFAGAMAQTPQAVRQASADRDAQVRRAQEQQRATGRTDQKADEFVESADTVVAAGDDDEHHQDQRKRKRRQAQQQESQSKTSDEGKPRLDIRA